MAIFRVKGRRVNSILWLNFNVKERRTVSNKINATTYFIDEPVSLKIKLNS